MHYRMKILRGNLVLFVSERFRKKHEAGLQTISWRGEKYIESNKTIVSRLKDIIGKYISVKSLEWHIH